MVYSYMTETEAKRERRRMIITLFINPFTAMVGAFTLLWAIGKIFGIEG